MQPAMATCQCLTELRYNCKITMKFVYIAGPLNLKAIFELFFFSAHNCRHFPSRNWSRWTLWLYIPDSVASVDSYVQSITSPNGCIPCLADKACLHSIAEWHTALRVMYVRRSFVLLSWFNCGVHNNNVPWCFLWSYRNFHHCRDNFDFIASIC